MTSLAVRYQVADNLPTPGHSALLIIDDQPVQAIRDGFEVYPVVDAVGGTSVESHRAGLERVSQAGGHAPSRAQFICELQRDWNRKT